MIYFVIVKFTLLIVLFFAREVGNYSIIVIILSRGSRLVVALL